MPACIGLTDDQIVPPHEGVPTDAAPCNVGFNNVTTGTTTCKINVTNFCAGAKNLTACRDYAAAHTACPEKYDDVQANGECAPFDFRRLGLRSTALLLSPWVQKGKVFQQPVGPSSTSQFEHSSISATLKNLYNLSDFLTARDAWAGSLHELLLDAPRPSNEMPMHLPEAPPPAQPWTPNPAYPPTTTAASDDDDDRRRRLASDLVRCIDHAHVPSKCLNNCIHVFLLYCAADFNNRVGLVLYSHNNVRTYSHNNVALMYDASTCT